MKKIGIIGGMGPMATVDLMQKIIASTKASSDQEHIHILVDNNTEIPDRTAAILGKGPSPVFEMVRAGLDLEKMGADVLVMACNTAHYFLPQIQPFFHIPVLNMIEEAARHCARQKIECVALLASKGTYSAGIYETTFQKAGIRMIIPEEAEQQAVQDMIYEGVKAGNPSYDCSKVEDALTRMGNAGAQAFVMGCTEIPLAVSMYHIAGHYIDSTQILAEEAVRFVGASVAAKEA